MSLDLIELPRIKVSPETHALISAEAEISGEEINAVVRDWLHDRASREVRKISLANRALKARGLPCIGVGGEKNQSDTTPVALDSDRGVG